MDTVTETEMAIAMARQGAIGILHRNLSVNQQASFVTKVKREESIIIRNVHTVAPETPIIELRNIMKTKNIGGLPVVAGEKLVGIVTKRDLEFAGKDKKTVHDIMVKDVIYAHDNIDIKDANEFFTCNHRESADVLGLHYVSQLYDWSLRGNCVNIPDNY